MRLIPLAQIPTVLFSTGWSNHQLIMSQCKTNEQRLFYILYSGHEQLEYKICQEPVPSGKDRKITLFQCFFSLKSTLIIHIIL